MDGQEIKNKLLEMINTAKVEHREFNPDEQKVFDELKNELLALAEEVKAVKDEVNDVTEAVEEMQTAAVPKTEEPAREEQPASEEEEKTEDAENDAQDAPQDAPQDDTVDNTEDNSKDDSDAENGEKQDVSQDDADDQDKKTKRNIPIMKNFSLIKTIRAFANGSELDNYSKAVLDAGAEEFRANGLEYTGQIQIPMENRTLTVATEHDDVIETDFMSILTPLYAKTALVESGAQVLTGLKGDIQLPIMNGKNNCFWEGETDETEATTNTFTSKKAKPHRLACYMDISKQMLA